MLFNLSDPVSKRFCNSRFVKCANGNAFISVYVILAWLKRYQLQR